MVVPGRCLAWHYAAVRGIPGPILLLRTGSHCIRRVRGDSMSYSDLLLDRSEVPFYQLAINLLSLVLPEFHKRITSIPAQCSAAL